MKLKSKDFIAWEAYFDTGIEIVDQQHHGLIDLVNKLASTLESDSDLTQEESQRLLNYLKEYAKIHFSQEEGLMTLSGVDDRHLEHHRQTHLGFIDQLADMATELGARGGLSGQQFMEFLANWLVFHILGEDLSMGRQIKSISEGVSSEIAFDQAVTTVAGPAQATATQCLAKLYALVSQKNRRLQTAEKAHQSNNEHLSMLVTQRNDELTASEENFRALFHKGALPVIILPVGESFLPGLISDANPAACALLGYTHEEMLTLAPRDLVPPEEIVRFPLLINELLAFGHLQCEMTHITKADKRITTQMNMTRLVFHGQLIAMTVLEDISERGMAGSVVESVQKEARRLAQIRGDFIVQNGQNMSSPKNGVLRLVRSCPDHAAGKVMDVLRRQPLFQDFAAGELAELAAFSREKHLRKDEILFRSGDKPIEWFLVISGQVKLAMYSARGNEKVMEIIGPEQCFGEAEMFVDRPYSVFAQSIVDTWLLCLGQAELFDLVKRNAAFAQRLLQRIGLRVNELVREVESYTLNTGIERVITYLLQHAAVQSTGGLEAKLPASKGLIASLLNLSPESLSRIFQDLSSAGLIRVKGRGVHILDARRLCDYQASLPPPKSRRAST